MADKVLISDRTKKIIIERFNEVIEATPNPDLAKSILYMLERSNQQDTKELKIKLGLEREDEIADIVENHLIHNGLILQSNFSKENFRIGEEGRIYIESEPYGPRDLIVANDLDSKVILACMNSVSDLVEFTYEKRFEFPRDKLNEIKIRSHKALEAIRDEEKEFFYDVLGVPREFIDNIPTFVSEATPHIISGYEKHNFDFYGNFSSPEKAFQTGFDTAKGFPKLETMMESGYGLRDYLPASIHINVSKRLVLENIRYQTTRDPFKYQQKAKEILPVLQERLENSLT